jgi:hypothetical protein
MLEKLKKTSMLFPENVEIPCYSPVNPVLLESLKLPCYTCYTECKTCACATRKIESPSTQLLSLENPGKVKEN